MNNFKFSEKSEQRLINVHPDLIKIVRYALKISTIDFGILEGLRTISRQKELFASGASKTLNSRHLSGHAIDIVAYVDEKISWEWQYYEQLANTVKSAAKELKIPIEWGGDWKSLKDGPHFQLPFKEYPV
ncbi:M15 family peptidase [Yersinia hibernica]|uniref:M15 family peptidase n=1 Tax=Yersinia hibernica TaxID=2339259 RepID=A0ABX5R6I3_9GAMM|nr:M15 family peptidase [Yersinia hibernica]